MEEIPRELIAPDDEYLKIRSKYLGPRGFTIPFAPSYAGLGLGSFAIGMVILFDWKVGLFENNPTLAGWTISFTIIAVALILKFTSQDIKVKDVFRISRNEF